MTQKELEAALSEWLALEAQRQELQRTEAYAQVKKEIERLEKAMASKKDALMEAVKAAKKAARSEIGKNLEYVLTVGARVIRAIWQFRPAQAEGWTKKIQVTQI